MNNEKNTCSECGQTIHKKQKSGINMSLHLSLGAFIGLIAGAVFDYYYFYIGVVTDFFTFMPIVHIIACLLIGLLAGWIVGEKKELQAYRRGLI